MASACIAEMNWEPISPTPTGLLIAPHPLLQRCRPKLGLQSNVVLWCSQSREAGNLVEIGPSSNRSQLRALVSATDQ